MDQVTPPSVAGNDVPAGSRTAPPAAPRICSSTVPGYSRAGSARRRSRRFTEGAAARNSPCFGRRTGFPRPSPPRDRPGAECSPSPGIAIPAPLGFVPARLRKHRTERTTGARWPDRTRPVFVSWLGVTTYPAGEAIGAVMPAASGHGEPPLRSAAACGRVRNPRTARTARQLRPVSAHPRPNFRTRANAPSGLTGGHFPPRPQSASVGQQRHLQIVGPAQQHGAGHRSAAELLPHRIHRGVQGRGPFPLEGQRELDRGVVVQIGQ